MVLDRCSRDRIRTGRDQRGLTFISWVVLFAVIGFFALIIMKLVPIYIEHNAVRSAMKATADELPPASSTRAAHVAMAKRLGVNDVDVVKAEDFQLVKDGPSTYLEVEYEARTGVFGNISIVVTFTESFQLGGSATE
jgi:hypothetical protein